ncbi:transferrin-binding protein-like solute binding protein [Brenneria goodwinii]|uniref:transferrin-binding protein-like solute binding protein n=1 Tax=Brenneria goodwinii TaxID=1109412 RepID=UPI0015FF0256|nr:transferrin-binding protein-like solute binding protein [Brenneria goodwinii]MCG8156456.1 transferrin-binding protein-like solute binding protein [Brenneria goodwinii]MCG8162173.1 transferrin-binding protein-like solute binding protein [Brenneria goodwinii]MCG8166785.1 transferrin-binding protein-like solute binding protein [Brenneria goodwinii]MCG8171435.1 transferrin-binding protein-like solute binding protein [Brenneria goodwinii]MCG8175143.1 transferrin-binding protein-like solute bindi
MRKFFLTAIALAAHLALSACSTSDEVVFNTGSPTTGGGGDNNDDGLVYKKDSIPADALTVSGNYVERNGEGGDIGAITDTTHAIAGSRATLTDTYSIVQADGTTYNPIYSYQSKLLEEAVAAGDDFYVLDRLGYYGLIKYFGVNLGSALWGLSYATSSSVGGNGYLEMAFAQGFATDTDVMSALTGTATYAGRAIISGAGFDIANGTSVEADSAFSVDFGSKTLTGTLSPSSNSTTSFDDISLAAAITGNSFSGEKDGTTTAGQFYGANGNELAGTFSNSEKDFLGAYGAIKGVTGDGSGDDGSDESGSVYVSGGYRTVRTGLYPTGGAGIDEITQSEKSLNELTDPATVAYGKFTVTYADDNGWVSYYDNDTKDLVATIGQDDPIPEACQVNTCIVSIGRSSALLYDFYTLLRYTQNAYKLTLYDAGYLYFPGRNASGSTPIGSSVVGFNLKYAQWFAGSSDNRVFGDMTPENSMPISGSVTYSGLAGTSTTYSTLANKSSVVIPSTALFSVDFTNKSFAGTIAAMDKSIDDIELGGRVTGNSFVGTKDGFTTQGYFYGPNAAEMAGVYQNAETMVQGAFGAQATP